MNAHLNYNLFYKALGIILNFPLLGSQRRPNRKTGSGFRHV